jgi:hypothetical protein
MQAIISFNPDLVSGVSDDARGSFRGVAVAPRASRQSPAYFDFGTLECQWDKQGHAEERVVVEAAKERPPSQAFSRIES